MGLKLGHFLQFTSRPTIFCINVCSGRKMAEADQNALVIRRKVTRSAGNPAHDAAVAREYRDRCAKRITIAPSPLKFKTNPVIALSDVVFQEHRGAVEGCENDVGVAVPFERPNCK